METKLQTAPHLAETGRRAKRLTAVGRFAAVVCRCFKNTNIERVPY